MSLIKSLIGRRQFLFAAGAASTCALTCKKDEAMRFSGATDQVLLLGDCTGENGNLQKALRSAFFTASQV